MRFIGEASPYDQILQWSSELDKYPINAKERDSIIEQFSVFASNSPANIQKLIQLNIMRHAAITIHANSPSTVVKSLNLCGYLLSEDHTGKASKQIEEGNTISDVVSFLESSNENFRIEALYIIEKLGQFSDPINFRDQCSRNQILFKVA